MFSDTLTAVAGTQSAPGAGAAVLPKPGGRIVAPIDLLTQDDAWKRSQRVSEVELELALRFRAGAESFRGEARLSFNLSAERGDLRLDLKCERLERLLVNGRPVEARAREPFCVMLPAHALREGANLVELTYEAAYDRSGNGMHHFLDPVDGREYLYSNFEPFSAHRVLPCFDQPDLKIVMRLTVTSPVEWLAVTNTVEERNSIEGECVTRFFRETPRLSSYLLFLALGPYAMVEDRQARVPSRLFARQSMARYLDPDEIFELTRAGLEFFGDYYGVPYPFEKYDQLFVPEFNPGGMENPAAVTFHEMVLFRHEPSMRERGRRADVILHEMAHMWFGDLVTMRWWDGLWLNESFATFMAAHAQAKATRFDDAWEEFLTADKAWALWQDQLPTTHPIAGTAPDTDMAFANFDGITYGKGASVLKQLARFVGEESFQRGVQAYMRKYAWGNTDLPDFFQALGEAAGIDLTDWARLHIETAGVNTLQPHLDIADGKLRGLELEQLEGNGDRVLRPQRLEVALYHADADGALGKPLVLPVSVSGARTIVDAAAGLPAPVFVWANHEDHAYLRVLLDPASLDFARQHLERLPDSRTRRAVWLTLWEMVREGKLAPAAYLDTFLAKAPVEPSAKVQQGQFRNALTALNHYLTGSARESTLGRMNALAWQQAEASAAGGDAQKEWLDLAIDTSAEASSLGRLAGLLDGEGNLPGLEMHPERRWNMVVRLCAYGWLGASDRVATELLRDGTDLGRRQALRAETSLPDLARKESLWRRCLEDRRTSGSDLKVGLAGLHWPHQEALSRQFVERYFTAIQEVRATRDQEFANAFAEICFPANVHDFDVVRKLNAYIGAHPDLPGDLRKILLNLTDEMLRCLRLRAQWR